MTATIAQLYTEMARIRAFERWVANLYRDGEVPGFSQDDVSRSYGAPTSYLEPISLRFGVLCRFTAWLAIAVAIVASTTKGSNSASGTSR